MANNGRIGPRVVGIDPGTHKSAWAWIDGTEVLESGYASNEDILRLLLNGYFGSSDIAIEMVASYGMPVGEDTFETCLWIGRFIQACDSVGSAYHKVYRKQDKELPGVLMHICKSNRASDSNVRQAIIDMYEPSGGGKTPQVGTSKHPGPLFGVSSHIWQALAVAITCRDGLQMSGVSS